MLGISRDKVALTTDYRRFGIASTCCACCLKLTRTSTYTPPFHLIPTNIEHCLHRLIFSNTQCNTPLQGVLVEMTLQFRP